MMQPEYYILQATCQQNSWPLRYAAIDGLEVAVGHKIDEPAIVNIITNFSQSTQSTNK